MKHFIMLALVSIWFVACTSIADKQNKANTELVNNYIKSVESLDYESMDKYLDDAYMGIGPSFGDTIRKTEAIASWKENVTNLYEKIHYNRSRTVSVSIPDGDNKGEWVANWAELNIAYKNKKGEVTIWANTNYLIENGKIIRSFTVYNEADALRQLGYKIVAPTAQQ